MNDIYNLNFIESIVNKICWVIGVILTVPAAIGYAAYVAYVRFALKKRNH